MSTEVMISLATAMLTFGTVLFRGGRIVQEVSTLSGEVQSMRMNVKDMGYQLARIEANCPRCNHERR